MEDRWYTVFVVGAAVPAARLRENLVAAGVRPDQADTILATMPCQVKANQPREVAERFAEMFREAGAHVELVPVGVRAPGAPLAAGSPPAAEATAVAAPAADAVPAAATDAPAPASSRAARLEAEIAARRAAKLPRDPRSFPPLHRRLGRVVPYLRQPSVLLVLLGLSVLTWLLGFVPLLGGVLVGGLNAAVYFRIVEATAHGEEMLDPPDFTDVWDDVLAPLVRYVATTLPMLVGLVWAGANLLHATSSPLREDGIDLVATLGPPGVLFLAGVVLWPLLTVVAALERSALAVLNPLAWIAALRTVGASYVVAAAAFYAVLALESFVVLPLLLSAAVHVPIPVVMGIALTFALNLFMAARARILGALCEPYV